MQTNTNGDSLIHVFAYVSATVVSTFWVMVLHSDDLSSCLSGRGEDGFGIDGFQCEWINDTDIDTLGGQLVSSFVGLGQCDTATDDGHYILVRLAHNLEGKHNAW